VGVTIISKFIHSVRLDNNLIVLEFSLFTLGLSSIGYELLIDSRTCCLQPSSCSHPLDDCENINNYY
jgi:hypothetical protein